VNSKSYKLPMAIILLQSMKQWVTTPIFQFNIFKKFIKRLIRIPRLFIFSFRISCQYKDYPVKRVIPHACRSSITILHWKQREFTNKSCKIYLIFL